MNWVLIAAFIAVCGAAKLDRTYLPPSSANSAGGSPGSLQAPLTKSSEQASVGFPTGSYTNNFEGVVVDAASSGTRSSDAGQSGLGNPRPSYGSSDSKVGDAAFRGTVAGFRGTPSFEASSSQGGAYEQSSSNTQNLGANGFTLNGEINTHTAQGFPSNRPVGNHQTGSHAGQFSNNFQDFTQNKPERPQSAKDRNSNILTLSNDVNTDSYSYGFETDNGIAVGENGVAMDGIQAEGGYSYQGDDGQVYKVTYTADEGGYRPQGAHLPTPPPIPDEILKSLEQNAKEEAAGLIDDGSYDAQKYNADGDYTHDNSGNIQYNGAQFGKRPDSNTPIGTFNQNNHAYGKPGSQTSQPGAQSGAGFNAQAITGHSTQGNGQFGTGHFGIASNEHNGQFSKPGSGELGSTGQSTFNGQPGSTVFGSQSSHTTFEQSSLNQFNSNPVLPHNVNSGSQSSHSRQPLSGQGNVAAGQAFTQNTGNQFSSLSDQASGASGTQAQFGSQFNQHASGSTQLGNQSPEASLQNNQQLAQFGSKPSFTQGAESFQSTQPQFGSSFKPQGSEAFSGASLNKDQDAQDFGKPFPQTFSGQNFNRPSLGNFNKPTFGQGQTYKGSSNANGFTRFPQASGQVGVVNDYIPPFNKGQSQPDKSTVSAPGLPLNLGTLAPSFNGVEAGQKEQIPDLAVNKPKPGFASASASTSFGQPAFQPQPVKPLNVFNTQPQLKPNQFTQQHTTQFTPQTNQLASQAPTQFNTNSQYSGQSVSDLGSKPTAVPDTELTTPLEPNESSASQGSQSSSQTVSTFDSSSAEPASSQAHFGLQENSASGQSISQTLPSSFPTTTSQISPGFETASSQNGFQSLVGKQPENINGKPQISGNTFGQNQQSQGIDNSYYYRQPTMPFGVPSAMSQGSRFPSSSSYQSNTIASQNQFFTQHNLQSTTKFPGSPSLATVVPTSSTQLAQTQGYSGITQAAISPFPSISSTPSSQYGMTQNGQFASKPIFNQQSTGNQALSLETTKPSYNQQSFSNQAQITENQGNAQLPQPDSSRLPLRPITQIDESQTLTQSGQPESLDSSSQQQAAQVQQYQGTVYQYNKPTEVIPAPSKADSSSSQSIQTGITSESKPSIGQSQGNQLSLPSTQQILKPDGSFGTQNRPFGSAPTGVQGQHSQAGPGSQIIQQTGIQSGSQQTQFNAPSPSNTHSMSSELQPAKPFGTTSTTQFGSLPASPTTQGIPSSFETKPQFIGQTQFSQTFGNSRPSQAGYGSGSQFFQNSGSSQSNGYFYPGYPKPQFGEVPKMFNYNSQSGKPQSGLNLFNQNAHLGHPLTTSFFNHPSSNFNPGLVHQSQDGQFPQATFGQKIPNSPIQPFSPSKFGQSTASSQAVASGQATASASASNSPQQYKPFDSQNKNQFGQKDSQVREPTQFDAQNAKPFGSIVQEANGAPSSKPFGSGSQGSKPLFDSACCQGTKDSTPAQSTDRPNQGSFQGTQNAQSFGGKGEEFGGPRQPPTFDDQTGYQY